MSNFETYLETKVLEGLQGRTKEAMHYSLMNGGKRVRPQLLFSALAHYDIDETIGYPVAGAIEMIHTYSLIHDDLPAMDNDDMRRGKPSCHKAYDEACAILAGDGLLTRAFSVALEADCSSEQKVQIIQALSGYAGIDGMIYGQELDIQSEENPNPTMEQLLDIHLYKTAKLITLPLVCASILANKLEDIPIMEQIGLDIGIQFQIQDDILDVTQSADTLGKSTSDVDNDKMTAVSLMGLEQAKQKVEEYKKDLESCIQQLQGNTQKLEELIDYLGKRTY